MDSRAVEVTAKQTAKNLWYLDVKLCLSTDDEFGLDRFNLTDAINKFENDLRNDGRKLVSDLADE